MKLTQRIGAVGALSALLLVAGCGGSDSKSAGDSGDTSSSATSSSATTASSTTTSASTSTSDPSTPDSSAATTTDFASETGQQIADASKADMQGLQEVHYSGSVSTKQANITLDIHAKRNGDCSGTVGLKGGKATVLSAGGTSWFKGDLAFWKSAVGAKAQQVVDAINGRWVLDSDNNFKQFCDLDDFFGGLFSQSDGSAYTTKGTDTLDGQPVVLVVRSSTSDGPSTGYVLNGDKHYLLKIERTGNTGEGALSFDAFDEDFDVTAPAAADVVDPSTLQ